MPPATPLLRRLVPRALGRVTVARLVIGVWLAVHGAVVAGAPLADAMAGHAQSVVAHWEDAQDTSCPPQHDPATCQLCQQISTDLSDDRPDRVAAVPVVLLAESLPRDLGAQAIDAGRLGSPDPRGPPVV